MASESSFDIVSTFDRQEIDNALNIATKEIANRYDFRGTDTTLSWQGKDAVIITSASDDRARAALEVFREKLVRRGISMKAVKAGDPTSSGTGVKLICSLVEGIDKENAKKISAIIRNDGPKGVKSQIQGDELRVSSKKRDDLQAIIALLKEADLDIALQFTNYR